MRHEEHSISKQRFFTHLAPAHNIKLKLVPRKKFSKQLLDAMYHETLPGLIRSWREIEFIEVGLLSIAVPLTRRWIRGHRAGVQICLIPEEVKLFDFVAFAATSQLGTHKALVPREIMLEHGTLVLSPFHKYFTHHPVNIKLIKELVEQRREEKNIEFRALLKRQQR